MVKKIGEIKLNIISVVESINKEVIFEVWYWKDNHKEHYKIFMVFEGLKYNIESLGNMIFKIKELKKYREGKISYNDLPKKVMEIAKKEAILSSL